MNTPAKRARKRSDTPDPLAPQRELTPAPVAPAANDEARQSIATINTQLAEFDKVEAGLADLEKRHANVVYDCTVADQMDRCKEAIKEIQSPRFAVETARKAAKRPIIDIGRQVDGRAAVITERLLKIEGPLVDMKTKAEEAERNRKADLERRVDDIRRTAAQCIGKKSQQLQEVLDGLNTLPLADFQEYREQAAKAQLDATLAVNTLLTTAKQAEELADLQEKQRKEQARKDAIQQAIDAIGAPLQQLPMCRTSVRVQALIDNAEAVQIPEAVYQEFAAAAREKKAAVLAELTKVRDEKKTAEDARAAAPAPTPAATPAPTPAPGRSNETPHMRAGTEAHVQIVESLSDHDRINDEGAASLHRAFGSAGARGPGRSLEGDFRRVISGPTVAPRAQPEDPFTAPPPRSTAYGELSLSAPQRPSDGEMLAVLADHYEVDAATAAAWLRTFDAAAALAQQSLIPTT